MLKIGKKIRKSKKILLNIFLGPKKTPSILPAFYAVMKTFQKNISMSGIKPVIWKKKNAILTFKLLSV